MLEGSGGAIVHIASLLSFQGGRNTVAYAACQARRARPDARAGRRVGVARGARQRGGAGLHRDRLQRGAARRPGAQGRSSTRASRPGAGARPTTSPARSRSCARRRPPTYGPGAGDRRWLAGVVARSSPVVRLAPLGDPSCACLGPVLRRAATPRTSTSSSHLRTTGGAATRPSGSEEIHRDAGRCARSIVIGGKAYSSQPSCGPQRHRVAVRRSGSATPENRSIGRCAGEHRHEVIVEAARREAPTVVVLTSSSGPWQFTDPILVFSIAIHWHGPP